MAAQDVNGCYNVIMLALGNLAKLQGKARFGGWGGPCRGVGEKGNKAGVKPARVEVGRKAAHIGLHNEFFLASLPGMLSQKGAKKVAFHSVTPIVQDGPTSHQKQQTVVWCGRQLDDKFSAGSQINIKLAKVFRDPPALILMHAMTWFAAKALRHFFYD